MTENVVNALWITLVGMGLVFVAILLLWGGMALLVRLTAAREERPAADATPEDALVAPSSGAIPEDALLLDRKRRAAAAALAAALALRAETGASREAFPAGSLSPWQAVYRAGRFSPRQKPSRQKVDR
jgi:hypothetical protein